MAPLKVLTSNQFQEDMRRLAELKRLLPVALLTPDKTVSTRWGRASANKDYDPQCSLTKLVLATENWIAR